MAEDCDDCECIRLVFQIPIIRYIREEDMTCMCYCFKENINFANYPVGNILPCKSS